nr:hypothetical protein [Planctopirus limnophila]
MSSNDSADRLRQYEGDAILRTAGVYTLADGSDATPAKLLQSNELSFLES